MHVVQPADDPRMASLWFSLPEGFPRIEESHAVAALQPRMNARLAAYNRSPCLTPSSTSTNGRSMTYVTRPDGRDPLDDGDLAFRRCIHDLIDRGNVNSRRPCCCDLHRQLGYWHDGRQLKTVRDKAVTSGSFDSIRAAIACSAWRSSTPRSRFSTTRPWLFGALSFGRVVEVAARSSVKLESKILVSSIPGLAPGCQARSPIECPRHDQVRRNFVAGRRHPCRAAVDSAKRSICECRAPDRV